ncbi:hypothetical protein Q4Q34_05255 [Flavivirga abyssicola]|uniref:hypothetical protein n=1 Tax=Flavivirga abyssicola TaxID=3063533 RepID=UPI0026DF83A4|nr:hypothetical protein [Flavivirga sp. MEBiC07777]WVK14433.1 hypothetical protein Q4Q34_05255 [Flavivirga sp. MEBiC07777]
MKIKLLKNSIKILLLFICVSGFSQSPWTQEKGKFYTQLSYTTIPNYDTFFGDPDYTIAGKISDNTIQLYGEYGFSDNTTLIINLPLKLISINDFKNPLINCTGDCSEDFNESALGNLEIGIKYNFHKKDWVLSGQFSIEANTGSYDITSGIRTGYNAFTFTPLFLAGKSFEKTYVQSFIGANIRTNDYSSNFKVGGEFGYKITKHIWLIGFVDIVKSLKDGNIVLPIENTYTGLYVNNQDYGAYGFKGIGEITDKFGLTAGFGGAFFGNNVAKQAALNVGVYHKF